MPDAENTHDGDVERRSLSPDLQPLHDWLLADGAARHGPVATSDRLIKHAASLVAQGRDEQLNLHMTPAQRKRGKHMTTETFTPEIPPPAQSPDSEVPSRRRLISLIAAITLAAVVVVALAGALYLRQRSQQSITPTSQLIYALSQNLDYPAGHRGATTLTAFNTANGKTAWQYQPPVGSIGKYTVADGMVFVFVITSQTSGVSQQILIALDGATGRIRWQTPRQITVVPPAVVANHVVYYGVSFGSIPPSVNNSNESSAIVAARIEDGSQIWQTAHYPQRDTSIDAISNGVIYASSSTPWICRFCPVEVPETITKGLSAIDARNGHILWQADITGLAGSPINYLVTISNSLYFLQRADRNFNYSVQALRTGDGSVAWSVDNATILVANSATLYTFQRDAAGSGDNSIKAIAIPGGNIRWISPLPVHPSGEVNSSFALSPANFVAGPFNFDSNGHVSSGEIEALAPGSGTPIWQVMTGDAPMELIANGATIYALLSGDMPQVGSSKQAQIQHTILALDTASGKERWRVTDEDTLLLQNYVGASEIENIGSSIIFLTQGSLSAYSAKDGTLLWRIPPPGGNVFSSFESDS